MAVTGKVLLTGASSGIGLAAGLLLTEKGFQVVGTARDPKGRRERWERASGHPFPFVLIAMDLADPASVDRGFDEATGILGEVDVLVNNAGQGELGSVEDTDLEDSRKLFEVNYFSAVRLTKKVIPAMRARRRGIIVNLGSIVHDLQFPFKAQYCASKSALTGFSLSLRYELQPYGVRVHILEPGWVRSEFHNRLWTAAKPGSIYADRLKPFQDFSRDHDPSIPDGKSVAEILLHVLTNPKAPVRIAVGKEARRFRLLKHFLTPGMQDRLLLWKLAKKSR